MTKRKRKKKGFTNIRCPTHDELYVFQASEEWWRCPVPHCLEKVTVREAILEVAEELLSEREGTQ